MDIPFKPFVIVFEDTYDTPPTQVAYKILDPRAIEIIQTDGFHYEICLVINEIKGAKDGYPIESVLGVHADCSQFDIPSHHKDMWYAWREI